MPRQIASSRTGRFDPLFNIRCTRRFGEVPYAKVKRPLPDGFTTWAPIQELLRRLDQYEGADPSRPGAGLFRREVHRVTFQDGDTVDAWVYLYNRPVEEATLISSGDYVAFRDRS